VLSGVVLSQWLQQRAGTVVQGSLISLSPGGLLRVSAATDSTPVQSLLPVVHGGQAAVARARDGAGVEWALRAQAVVSEQDKTRQMQRLVSMLAVVTAARQDPGKYPAVLPVQESFIMIVPGSQVPMTGADPEYEVWCDLMAWCPQDLNDWQRTTSPQPPVAQVLGLFAPVLATVAAVHENLGIVHRDITPNNVLVDGAGRLLLADWGIAHGIAADQTSTYTQLIGNRGFALPPEMLAGDRSVGRYTDAWYLGCLLSWMLTSDTPGPQHGSAWLPAKLPTDPAGQVARGVITGLCAPDPHQRLGLPEALSALREGRVPTLPRPVSRRVPTPGTQIGVVYPAPAGLRPPGPPPGPRPLARPVTRPPGRAGATGPARPGPPRKSRPWRWIPFVLALVLALGGGGAGAVWLGLQVARYGSDEAGPGPSPTTTPDYVVWDQGTGAYTWQEYWEPVLVFTSADNLPRHFTCDSVERSLGGGATITANPRARLNMDPLVLTEDVEVTFDVRTGCGDVRMTLPLEGNWRVSWNGVREYRASPRLDIDSDFGADPDTWTEGENVFEHTPRPGEPVLHLRIEARASVDIISAYSKWRDGTGAFPMRETDSMVRYWFPSPAELPRSITCKTSNMTALDFRRAEITDDIDVSVDYAAGCPTNTLLLSPQQNWTIDWTGTGLASLQVGAGANGAQPQMVTGPQTVSHIVDPGKPTLNLTVTSAATVHVEAERAVY